MQTNKILLFEEFKEHEPVGEPLPDVPTENVEPGEPEKPIFDPEEPVEPVPGTVRTIGDNPDDENLTIDDIGNFDLPDNERLPLESDEEAHREPLRMAAEGNSVLSWEDFKNK